MTSPAGKPSLDEVLDELFYADDKLNSATIVRVCEAHPEYRKDIVEFVALWSAYEAEPEALVDASAKANDEAVLARLQSFVLNQVYEKDVKPTLTTDVEDAKRVLSTLAGNQLRKTADELRLGSSVLLQKIISNSILDIPEAVTSALAAHLRIAHVVLLRAICGSPRLRTRSFRAKSPPSSAAQESWQAAVQSLGLAQKERDRLLELQIKG